MVSVSQISIYLLKVQLSFPSWILSLFQISASPRLFIGAEPNQAALVAEQITDGDPDMQSAGTFSTWR